MKIRLFLNLSLAAICLHTTAFGADSKRVPREVLAQVPSAELPAKAAELVGAAKARQREKITVEVVRASVALNAAASASVVGAIAKAFPELAGVAAGTAAEALPNQAVEVARAAAANAPEKAGRIVAVVCRAAPVQYKMIAAAVAQVCPAASKQILQAVASVFPELKSGIEAAVASYGLNPPSVAVVLDTVKNPNMRPAAVLVSGAAPSAAGVSQGARGPTVAPPYVPYSSSGPNVTPNNSGTVPRGQRTYASP